MKQFKISTSITNRDSGSVEKYFHEVSKEPLLKADEEVVLAKKIKNGDEMALQKLVKANLRFVVSVAKQYQYTSISLNDLINEGNIGLIRAARSFDETRGFKFISYAVWWIRQSIMLFLSQHSRLIRIPYNKSGELSKINQASALLAQQLERDPTSDELATFLNIDADTLRNSETAQIKQSSLDANFGDDSGNLLDLIEDKNSIAADAGDHNSSLRTDLFRLLKELSKKEKEIILRSFGIGTDYIQSLDDIANNLGITRERVRQIKENALQKLRSKNIGGFLINYL